MSQLAEANASPNQTQADSERCFSPFPGITLSQRIPAPFPLIQERAHAGAGTRSRKNFFMNIPLPSSPIPEPLLLWTRGAHNRWQQEPSPRLALKLSTQAYQLHSPHTSGPVAAQGGLSPSTPHRPRSSRCRDARGDDLQSSCPLHFLPSLSIPAFSHNRAVMNNVNALSSEHLSHWESGLLADAQFWMLPIPAPSPSSDSG